MPINISSSGRTPVPDGFKFNDQYERDAQIAKERYNKNFSSQIFMPPDPHQVRPAP